MQGGIKKEYRTLQDKPVLVHSLYQFLITGLFYKIVITLPHSDHEKVKKLISPFIDTDSIYLTTGGTTRQESVFHGLQEFQDSPPEYILIHDGARPWIKEDLIRAVLTSTREYGACIPVVEIPDALKEVDRHGMVLKTLSRVHIKGAQTPQGFVYEKLYKAHVLAREKQMKALDDAQVYSLLYSPVKAIPGDIGNKKITYKNDFPGTYSHESVSHSAIDS
jgi:2-C-methyl-D-erythritol 4-phosphate cytidylyltransferase